MLDESDDLKSDRRPARQGLRPFYLWTLVAAVAVMAVGSPALVRLSDQAGAAGYLSLGWAATALHGVAFALILATLVLAPIAAIRGLSRDCEASRSYGGSAVLAAAAGIGFAVLQILSMTLQFLRHTRSMPGRFWSADLFLMSFPAAIENSVLAITVAWLTLALTGVGRRASNGFERISLGVGGLWILLYLGRHVLEIAPWLL